MARLTYPKTDIDKTKLKEKKNHPSGDHAAIDECARKQLYGGGARSMALTATIDGSAIAIENESTEEKNQTNNHTDDDEVEVVSQAYYLIASIHISSNSLGHEQNDTNK